MTDNNKKQIIVPCIHMNGTSKKDLSDRLEEAHDAIGVAYDRLRQTAPNLRDYYVYEKGSIAYEIAANQHYDRMKRLHDVQNELEAIIGGILDGEKFVDV